MHAYEIALDGTESRLTFDEGYDALVAYDALAWALGPERIRAYVRNDLPKDVCLSWSCMEPWFELDRRSLYCCAHDCGPDE